MSLLSEYTISLLENDKIVVDFTDTMPSEYERMELLRFFRKYKRQVFVEFEGNQLLYMVLPWQHWIEFLIALGFKDTAKATTEILNDLDVDRMPSLEDYVHQLKNAKIVKDFGRSVVEDKNRANWEYLKEQEVKRLTRKEVKEKEQEENSECDDEDKDDDVIVLI